MKDLQQLNELIDKAAAIAGSDGKLAKVIRQTRTTMSDWRHGRRTCTPEDVSILAAVAGLNAEEWLIRAMLEKHAGTEKGELLVKALGKGSRVTGGAIAFSGTVASQTSGSDVPRCIFLLSFALQRTKHRRRCFFFAHHRGPERVRCGCHQDTKRRGLSSGTTPADWRTWAQPPAGATQRDRTTVDMGGTIPRHRKGTQRGFPALLSV